MNDTADDHIIHYITPVVLVFRESRIYTIHSLTMEILYPGRGSYESPAAQQNHVQEVGVGSNLRVSLRREQVEAVGSARGLDNYQYHVEVH